MNRPLPAFLLSTFYFCIFASGTLAESSQSDPILQLIRSTDPQQQKQGITQLQATMERDGKNTSHDTVQKCLDALRDQKLNEPALDITDRALRIWPKDKDVTTSFLGYKTSLLLAKGNKPDALAALRQAVALSPASTANMIEARQLGAQLAKASLTDETIDLLDQITLACLGDAYPLQNAQSQRVQTLLAAGKPVEALAAAKSLYNVSGMAGTSKALQLVAKCLQAAYPDNHELLQKFREEQVAGAVVSATTQPTQVKSTVMAGIKVSAPVYEKAFGDQLVPASTDEDYAKLRRMGNLLLLLDRPAEARPWFEQAYRVCAENQVTGATESLAMVLKAEDGTIGRANAWVTSLRPNKPDAKQP